MCRSVNKDKFETKLKEVYSGAVVPLTNYVNDHSVMVFKCNSCDLSFFAKPSYLIGKEHQLHICNMPYGDKNGLRILNNGKSQKNKKGKSATPEQFNELIWNDYTYQEIAKKLNINPSFVREYFVTEGLI